MTFKLEKVKWLKIQPYAVSWDIIQAKGKLKSKFIAYYTKEYTTIYIIRSKRRKMYTISI